jgi:hypothetical protein
MMAALSLRLRSLFVLLIAEHLLDHIGADPDDLAGGLHRWEPPRTDPSAHGLGVDPESSGDLLR